MVQCELKGNGSLWPSETCVTGRVLSRRKPDTRPRKRAESQQIPIPEPMFALDLSVHLICELWAQHLQLSFLYLHIL